MLKYTTRWVNYGKNMLSENKNKNPATIEKKKKKPKQNPRQLGTRKRIFYEVRMYNRNFPGLGEERMNEELLFDSLSLGKSYGT